MESKTVFITDATSGIGAACAEKLAAAGHQLTLCGRRNERLIPLSEKLEKEHKISTLCQCADKLF